MANSDNKNKDSDKTVKDKEGRNKRNKNKKPPSKSKKYFKNFLLTILITGLIVAMAGIGYVVAVIKNAPELDVTAILNLNQPSMLYDNKEEFIDILPTQEERYVIKYDQMPQNLVNAFISIEDERFRSHKGFDPIRLIAATLRDVKVLITGEGGLHGASTITQQLLKNTILYSEASSENHILDSVNRKIKEIYLSLRLEKELNKDQIIEAYLNTIPLSGYVYGVEAASKYFFGKPANELTLPECAYLAGITQAPTTYSAYNTEAEGYPYTYINRTKTVLSKMKELGYISEQEYTDAFAFVDGNQFAFKPEVIDYRVKQEWFVYPALDQVREDLKEKYKYTDDEVNKLFMNGGLKIYTTLDQEKQNAVQAALNDRTNLHVEKDENGEYTDQYSEEGVPLLQAAATVMDYRTGHVVALVGGRGDQPANSLNRAYDDLKPIASTTKALTVYSAAIDTKIMTAGTPIDDAPISNDLKNKYGFPSLNNYNFKFDGFITPRDAIAFSKNITSVKTVDKIGMETALDYGRKAGIKYNDTSAHSMSAIALGQHSNDVGENRDGGNTTLLASAFGSFGNNGVRIEPILYTKVTDSTGKVILEKEAKKTQLYSPQTAFIMYNILKEPLIRFDAGGAKFSDMPVSGKTGTTEMVDHFWFAGLTPYYSASVWIGYDMPQHMSGYSSAAADLFGAVMRPLHEGLEVTELQEPSGIVRSTICIDSGKLATDLCYLDQRPDRVRKEMFIEGTQPNAVCDVHVMVRVNKNNNKLATENTPKGLIVDRVFIKKDNASVDAADFPYVVPTQKDDTRAEEKINLSDIGLHQNMDLYDAIVILNDRGIKYTFKGESVSGTLKPNTYILSGFTQEIKRDGTVELSIKKADSGIGGGENNNGNNNNTDNNNDNNNNNNGEEPSTP